VPVLMRLNESQIRIDFEYEGFRSGNNFRFTKVRRFVAVIFLRPFTRNNAGYFPAIAFTISPATRTACS